MFYLFKRISELGVQVVGGKGVGRFGCDDDSLDIINGIDLIFGEGCDAVCRVGFTTKVRRLNQHGAAGPSLVCNHIRDGRFGRVPV